MREIKFRAWDKENEEMYDVAMIDMETGEVAYTDHPTGYNADALLEQVELMQYTGLKDKNGKEIYEGDVVKRTIYPLNQYSYDEYYQIKELNYYIYKGEKYGHFNVSLWSTDCEVIGNIYETPELLEGENG